MGWDHGPGPRSINFTVIFDPPQERYVVPLLGRRATYDDMRYAERFVLDTVDVLKTWNAIMEKRKQQEEKQAQHFDL